MKLIKIVEIGETRISGTGSFPAPQKKDIGREVIVTRRCINWYGCLGYFKDDIEAIKYAFYLDELN